MRLDEIRVEPRRRSKHGNFVRCTRRYTPGLCMEPVVPVWSFAFQIQNCTERLGCPVDWRGNRFGTYEGCMRKCLPLIEIYLEILTQDHNNVSSLRIGRYWGSPIGLSVDEQSFLDEDEDYEVLLRKVTVEGPPPDPMDDDADRKFQNIPDIDYYDNEERKDYLDEDLLKN
ncbi:hypothetical protein KGM_214480 [Danaus plexippus plexippus]|uniref:BPTI/Kunitz inhibitor domain-containing protein n=1 Tax=Danaus plexippus plexippus TaxID=278856 RepID=A0A212EJY0_DANPL|nr:hypothetical protein KGM_214480 [Danaus plexippus plexippus]